MLRNNHSMYLKQLIPLTRNLPPPPPHFRKALQIQLFFVRLDVRFVRCILGTEASRRTFDFYG